MRCLCCGFVVEKASASNPHICDECDAEHRAEPEPKPEALARVVDEEAPE